MKLLPFAALMVLAGCTGTIDPGSPATRVPAGPAGAPGAVPAGADATGAPGARSEAGGGAAGADPVRPPQPLAEFQCGATATGATPRRLWRLRGAQFANTVAVLFRGRAAVGHAELVRPSFAGPFDFRNENDRFSTSAASYTMTDQELDRLFATTADIATTLVSELRADTKSCLGAPSRPPLADCLRSLVAERGPLLFSRPLTAAEVAQYTAVATRGVSALGEDGAAALVFQALFTSPSFLYRTEVGAAAPDAAGRVQLTPYEVASALAYTLTDWPPSEALYHAAASGGLSAAADVAAQARQLLAGGAATPATVNQFLREAFSIRTLDKVFKANKDLDSGNKPNLLGDFDALVADIVVNNAGKDFWKTVLTTTTTYYQTATYRLYNLPDPNQRVRPVKATLPAADRAGLLTQPAWLASLSEDTATKPVARGRFVAENLLCHPLPAIPIGVVPVLPADPTLTLREKLTLHDRDPGCAACHHFMDPIGLVFEAYDPNGRLRTDDNGRPPSGAGALVGAGAQDVPVTGPADLAQKLAASPVVEQCLVRQSFRYWMGRNEAPWDGCTLVAAQRAYASAGSYLDLVATLFASPSFLFRSAN